MVNPKGDPPFPRRWQKSAVVYQIYPSSFADGLGKGSGTLTGIINKLDYLRDLGADVLWLSPIYPSPFADAGYDISDYRDIDPKYGTLDDWDCLVRGAHERGMKLIMDLVVNHTSDEHAWFRESRESKTSPKRDWYIWRPPGVSDEGERIPPNNWRACFQGSVWEYDSLTDEYYLHIYHTKQPDLNWENPAVREAIFSMMRFWLDRGCDGFRMDVINLISKVDGLPNAPVTDPKERYQWGGQYFVNGPRVHEFLREMNAKVLSHYDNITVGESPFSHSAEELAKYVLPENKELDMVFQFELMDIDQQETEQLRPREWKLSEFKSIVTKWQQFRRDDGYWNAVYIQNHDNGRAVSRFGNTSTEDMRVRSAKLLALVQIAQGGTLYVYQGEELGMKNLPKSWPIEEYKDVATQNYYHKVKEQRIKETGDPDIDMSDIMADLARKARDHARSPMQWDSSSHAGFTTGTPWMRVNDDYKTINVAAQVNDLTSVLNFYKAAFKIRKEYDVLTYGDFKLLLPNHPQLFALTRTLNDNVQAFVVLNFSTQPIAFEASEEVPHLVDQASFALGNVETKVEKLEAKVDLQGYEGRVYVLYKD